MGSLEILTYVCAASLALGFLICYVALARPYRWENESLRIRNTQRGLQRLRDDMDEAAYRNTLRTEHAGTPYTKETLMYATLGKLLADQTAVEDNERWSRKAELRAVES